MERDRPSIDDIGCDCGVPSIERAESWMDVARTVVGTVATKLGLAKEPEQPADFLTSDESSREYLAKVWREFSDDWEEYRN